MKHQWKNFRSLVMRISHQERRKATFEKFKREMEHFRNLETDELRFEYIRVKSQYEHQKMVLIVFAACIGIGMLMSIWEKFLSFMEMALRYTAMETDEPLQIVCVSLAIAVPVLLFCICLIFIFMFFTLKETKRLRKKEMLIHMVLNEKTHLKNNL